MNRNIFFWYYCLTMTVIYGCFVLLLLAFNVTSMALTNAGQNSMPILYFQSFMALWAYVLIPASVILMWWTYNRTQYALAFLFSALPIFIIFFTSKFFVTFGNQLNQ